MKTDERCQLPRNAACGFEINWLHLLQTKVNLYMNLELLKKIVSRYPQIVTAYLYGTAASGKLRPNSDIDVAILLTDPSSDEENISVETHLICDLEAAFHREADVKTLNRLEPLPLIHEILSKGVLLVDRDPETRRTFAAKKNLEYLDFLPHYERILKIYAERLWKRGTAEPVVG
jgi:hypothetical protein